MPLASDRVRETTTTTGTGALTLGGAPTGYESFASAFPSGAQVYYAIYGGGSEWEVGIGTVGGTFSRDVILQSSNSDALVSFSAGTKDVFCTIPSLVVNALSATHAVDTWQMYQGVYKPGAL